MCLLLGLRGHPGQGLDIGSQGFLEFIHHFQHSLLAADAEGLVHIGLPEGFAQQTVGHLHTALPACLQDLLTVKVASIEIEVLIDEGL